jgi:hypothetical protein
MKVGDCDIDTVAQGFPGKVGVPWRPRPERSGALARMGGDGSFGSFATERLSARVRCWSESGPTSQ